MRMVEIIIGVIWVAFWIYWFVAAIGTRPTRPWSRHFFGIRIAVIVIVLVAFRTGVLKGAGGGTVSNPLLQGIGLVVFLLGIALAVWARVYLSSNWGMPMSQRAHPELVTTGPYRYVRHPIYSGIILAMIGTAVAVSAYWIVAAALFGAYFIYSATVEERNMAERFPEAYPGYQASSKMLIPFVF